MLEFYAKIKDRMLTITTILMLLFVSANFILIGFSSNGLNLLYLILILTGAYIAAYLIKIYALIIFRSRNKAHRLLAVLSSVFILFVFVVTIYALFGKSLFGMKYFDLPSLAVLFLYSSTVYSVFMVFFYRIQKKQKMI